MLFADFNLGFYLDDGRRVFCYLVPLKCCLAMSTRFLSCSRFLEALSLERSEVSLVLY